MTFPLRISSSVPEPVMRKKRGKRGILIRKDNGLA
jgi:hypothetical protein